MCNTGAVVGLEQQHYNKHMVGDMKDTYHQQMAGGHYGDHCGGPNSGRSPEYLTAASYYGATVKAAAVKPTKIILQQHKEDVGVVDMDDEKPDTKQLRLKSEMGCCNDGQTPGQQEDAMTIKSEMHSTGSCRSITPPCNRRTPMTMSSSYDHCHDSNSSSMSSSMDAMNHHQQQQQQQQQIQQHGNGGMSVPSPHQQQQQHSSSGSYMMMDNNARLQHRPYEPQQINGGGGNGGGSGGGGGGGGQQQDMYNRSAAAAAAAVDRNYALNNINRPSPSYSTDVPTRSSYDHVRPPSYPNPLNAAVAAAAAAYADRYESDQSCQRYPSEYGDTAATAMYQPHQMIMKSEQPVQMDETIEPPLYPRYI